jgi:hypothetical protein
MSAPDQHERQDQLQKALDKLFCSFRWVIFVKHFVSGCFERTLIDSSSVRGARFSFLPNLGYGMISRRGVS